ncbi:MAG: helix-turn-helix transcriptional regulator, partial [Pseudomonadota bacterium]
MDTANYPSQENMAKDVGQRLKALRIGRGITPDELAKQSGVSRAAIYRYESGHLPKVDTVGKIADLLGVSMANIMGLGVEFIDTAVGYFERMRQIEESSEQICSLFGPISYVLTSDQFDATLSEVLAESIPNTVADKSQAASEIETLLAILRARKANFRRSKPGIVSLVSAAELVRFSQQGFIGTYVPPGIDMDARRQVAKDEIRNIIDLLRNPVMGTQIGLVIDSMPATSLQIFRQRDRTHVAVSPYRLGDFANIRIGVATIIATPEAVRLYESMTARLW